MAQPVGTLDSEQAQQVLSTADAIANAAKPATGSGKTFTFFAANLADAAWNADPEHRHGGEDPNVDAGDTVPVVVIRWTTWAGSAVTAASALSNTVAPGLTLKMPNASLSKLVFPEKFEQIGKSLLAERRQRSRSANTKRWRAYA